LGVDANADGLRSVSRRLADKRGRSNALFGRLSLEESPGELTGLADELTVLLPWGSLLGAVARGEVAPLAGLCKPGAAVQLVFGYGARSEAAAIASLGLPVPVDPVALVARYAGAGLNVRARPLPVAEVRALATTWAGKLAFSGRERAYWELRGARISTSS
jgi:16S rRNA (adenine(1408)-N(1))-methyltransferase